MPSTTLPLTQQNKKRVKNREIRSSRWGRKNGREEKRVDRIINNDTTNNTTTRPAPVDALGQVDEDVDVLVVSLHVFVFNEPL